MTPQCLTILNTYYFSINIEKFVLLHHSEGVLKQNFIVHFKEIYVLDNITVMQVLWLKLDKSFSRIDRSTIAYSNAN